MARLDERRIIEIFQKNFQKKIPAYDDVECFRIGKKLGVLKVDTLVASTDVPPGMSPSEIARKSIVSSVSDFAAKGVKPLYCITSVSMPRSYTEKKISQLALGFKKASKEFGFRILGGDTNEAKDLVISVVLFGLAEKIPSRKGAKNGDYIMVTGNFGLAPSGIKILLHKKKAESSFKKDAVRAVVHPQPRLAFGVGAAPYLTSSMDSSDGLSTTLSELSRQSKKKLVITNIPGDERVVKFAKSNGLDSFDLVFNGGEEFEIVATTSPKNFSKVKAIAKKTGIHLVKIGTVQSGSGVFLKDGRTTRIKDRGWSHFAN